MVIFEHAKLTKSYKSWQDIGGSENIFVQQRTKAGLSKIASNAHRLISAWEDLAPFRIIILISSNLRTIERAVSETNGSVYWQQNSDSSTGVERKASALSSNFINRRSDRSFSRRQNVTSSSVSLNTVPYLSVVPRLQESDYEKSIWMKETPKYLVATAKCREAILRDWERIKCYLMEVSSDSRWTDSINPQRRSTSSSSRAYCDIDARIDAALGGRAAGLHDDDFDNRYSGRQTSICLSERMYFASSDSFVPSDKLSFFSLFPDGLRETNFANDWNRVYKCIFAENPKAVRSSQRCFSASEQAFSKCTRESSPDSRESGMFFLSDSNHGNLHTGDRSCEEGLLQDRYSLDLEICDAQTHSNKIMSLPTRAAKGPISMVEPANDFDSHVFPDNKRTMDAKSSNGIPRSLGMPSKLVPASAEKNVNNFITSVDEKKSLSVLSVQHHSKKYNNIVIYNIGIYGLILLHVALQGIRASDLISITILSLSALVISFPNYFDCKLSRG